MDATNNVKRPEPYDDSPPISPTTRVVTHPNSGITSSESMDISETDSPTKQMAKKASLRRTPKKDKKKANRIAEEDLPKVRPGIHQNQSAEISEVISKDSAARAYFAKKDNDKNKDQVRVKVEGDNKFKRNNRTNKFAYEHDRKVRNGLFSQRLTQIKQWVLWTAAATGGVFVFGTMSEAGNIQMFSTPVNVPPQECFRVLAAHSRAQREKGPGNKATFNVVQSFERFSQVEKTPLDNCVEIIAASCDGILDTALLDKVRDMIDDEKIIKNDSGTRFMKCIKKGLEEYIHPSVTNDERVVVQLGSKFDEAFIDGNGINGKFEFILTSHDTTFDFHLASAGSPVTLVNVSDDTLQLRDGDILLAFKGCDLQFGNLLTAARFMMSNAKRPLTLCLQRGFNVHSVLEDIPDNGNGGMLSLKPFFD